jgi:hypothetical protein
LKAAQAGQHFAAVTPHLGTFCHGVAKTDAAEICVASLEERFT